MSIKTSKLDTNIKFTMSRPNLSYLKNLILAVVGIPCGVLTGVTGLSAAPILQPTLRYLLGLKSESLSGLVLVMVSFTAWSGLLSFGQTGHVQWFNGLMVTLGTFGGAALATKAVLKNPTVFVKARPFWTFLPLFFALMMIAQSTGVIKLSFPAVGLLPSNGPVLPLIFSYLIGVIVGFVGLVGELGSLLTIPLLVYLLGRSITAAEGTALFVLVLASLPTALIHALRRTVDMNTALAMSIGGVLGALFGSHLAASSIKALPDATLLFLCGFALTVFSLMSLFQKPTVDESAKPDSTTKNS
jgi:uncharacterized membrane protein YfcA